MHRLLKKTIMICFSFLLAGSVFSARIKDITDIAGVRENQLVGYGLVVGLDGTGDKPQQSSFTQQTFKNMLVQFGIRIPAGLNLQLKNVAAVAVSTKLPPFAQPGQTLDVTVASLGDATSLRSGQLLMTPLRGADNNVYAVAQGAVVVSGFGAAGADGSKVMVNSTASGRIPNGATIERSVFSPFVKNGKVIFELHQPDFTTAENIAKKINSQFHKRIARAKNAREVEVKLAKVAKRRLYRDLKGEILSGHMPKQEHDLGRYVPIISQIENITLATPRTKAKIIVNSRTGTIVVDQNITIAPVAVAHGNLSVVVSERPFVSQPNAFSNGKTVEGAASDINVNEQKSRAFLFGSGASLQELVDQINRVGAAPGDLIAILEAIKSAGALQADLEVI